MQRAGVTNPDVWRAWNGDGGMAGSTDLTSVLSSIRCPALVLVGEHDWYADRCGPGILPITSLVHGSSSSPSPGIAHSTNSRTSSTKPSPAGSERRE